MSNIFDPKSVKSLLRLVLKGREKNPTDRKNKNEWLVDWTTSWTTDSINDTVQRWKNAGCVGSEEQMYFVAAVIEYMKIIHRALIGHNGHTLVRVKICKTLSFS
ncbi:MAG TPA: hypothetical protein VGO47_14280 [Chlamydiales bacterium]|jgi:hypothetical protein|nr:hypothetical protein [Chlamydiales bacterium]